MSLTAGTECPYIVYFSKACQTSIKLVKFIANDSLLSMKFEMVDVDELGIKNVPHFVTIVPYIYVTKDERGIAGARSISEFISDLVKISGYDSTGSSGGVNYFVFDSQSQEKSTNYANLNSISSTMNVDSIKANEGNDESDKKKQVDLLMTRMKEERMNMDKMLSAQQRPI